MIEANVTSISAFGLVFALCMGVLTLVIPRAHSILPIFIVSWMMTTAQRIVIFDLDFTILRLILLACWLRILLRGELTSIRWNVLDKSLLRWLVCNVFIFTLLWQTGDALINRLGLAFNFIGLFFFFRQQIRDRSDVRRVFQYLAIGVAIVAVFMIVEKITARNFFSVFGGVPEFTVLRGGRLRAQGPFSHPILTGTFGATLFPLFFSLWYMRSKKLALLGGIASVMITFASASSGPVMALMGGIGVLFLWPLRDHMRALQGGVLLTLVALHLVMNAPVWFVVTRFTLFTGSSGWHRAALIDQFVNHFGEWWLLGIKSTEHWGFFMGDVANHYLNEGKNGGLITMILFFLVIIAGFKLVGRARRALDKQRHNQFAVWGIGCGLFAHVITFFSVSYLDQIIVFWYLQLALVGVLPRLVAQLAESKQEEAPIARIGSAVPALGTK